MLLQQSQRGDRIHVLGDAAGFELSALLRNFKKANRLKPAFY
jgi:acid stress-induced BolA-like protein IbaG/YrbA